MVPRPLPPGRPSDAGRGRQGRRDLLFRTRRQHRRWGDGWAGVWKRNYFAWEFKGRHKNLDAAHAQVAGYRDALQNPPLLIVSDFDRIHIRTAFTNTPAETHEIPIESLTEPPQLERLRAVFFDPDKLRPGGLDHRVTEAVAKDLAQVAQELRDRGLDPHAVARLLDRVVFCLFAEDVGLLPEKLMADLLEQGRKEPASFQLPLSGCPTALGYGPESVNRTET